MNVKVFTAKITFCSFGELTEQEKVLIESAKKSSLDAYAPYSGFKVGTALLLDNGEIISANNQENAAYPSGLCAERVAMFYANATFPSHKPVALAIAANQAGVFSHNPPSPCGACRQVLLESEQRFKSSIRMLLYGEQEIALIESAASLLPLSFTL